MEEIGCEIVRGASTTFAVKGYMVMIMMMIPESRCTLQCGAYHCGVGRRLHFWSTLPEIPSQEPACPVSSCCYILNIGKRGEVTADGDVEELAGTYCFQCLPIEEVAGCQKFSLLVGHDANYVFALVHHCSFGFISFI